jgi:methyl halide transferase
MTDWEERYRKGDMPWEKGEAAPPLAELIERCGTQYFGEGPVLVPGCGLGHDVRALASHGLAVTGLDLAELAIEKAKAIQPTGAESYEVGNFFDPVWQDGRKFSAIWEHTCFCAIDPKDRATYARSAAEVLIPGGYLTGVFFLTPHDPGEEEAGPPFGAAPGEIESYFSEHFSLVDSWVPKRAYPGREGKEWIAIFRRK